MTREEYLDFLNGDRPKTSLSDVDSILQLPIGTRLRDCVDDLWIREGTGIRIIHPTDASVVVDDEFTLPKMIARWAPFRVVEP